MKLIITNDLINIPIYCYRSSLDIVSIDADLLPDKCLTTWNGTINFNKIDGTFSHNVKIAQYAKNTSDSKFNMFSKGYFKPFLLTSDNNNNTIAMIYSNADNVPTIRLFCNKFNESSITKIEQNIDFFTQILGHTLEQCYIQSFDVTTGSPVRYTPYGQDEFIQSLKEHPNKYFAEIELH